jgi:dTDP-4-amino-4,6-dideoxygalactose transaminase
VQVPFIDLSRLTQEVASSVHAEWRGCLDRCEFVGGPGVGRVEKTLSKVLGVPRTVSCANGTDALIVGLQALGVKRGSKVAIPNLTFWATYEAVAVLGATPILVDIDPDDLQMSYGEFVKAHDEHRFDAAALVHLYGWSTSRLAEFRVFCKERGIGLLEDGAQCFGVEVHGEPVLAKATVGTLSFYPAKVVGGAMDGGAITLQSEEHEKLVRSLCNHGRADHYAYAHVGWNSRMGGVQAAFLSAILDRVPDILTSRRKAAEYYRKALSGHSKIRVYGPPPGIVENGYLNVLTVQGRQGQEIVDALKAKGIGSARTYPEPMDAQPPAQGVAIPFGSLAHSRSICKTVVNLPLFYGIREEECEASVKALLEVVG